MRTERRQHRRLTIRLPLECQCLDGGETHMLRCTTRDISAGGLYFEGEISYERLTPQVNSRLGVELTVPPGEGHFPYEGRVRGLAEIIRCERLDGPEDAPRRFGVAARFREPLELVF